VCRLPSLSPFLVMQTLRRKTCTGAVTGKRLSARQLGSVSASPSATCPGTDEGSAYPISMELQEEPMPEKASRILSSTRNKHAPFLEKKKGCCARVPLPLPEPPSSHACDAQALCLPGLLRAGDRSEPGHLFLVRDPASLQSDHRPDPAVDEPGADRHHQALVDHASLVAYGDCCTVCTG
jgi:hypothetical protein